MRLRIQPGKLPQLLLGIAAAVLSVFRPVQVPPLWFDEGWVLSLARNWLQLGHYGLLLAGERIPPSVLNTGLPAVAPVALSFRLFGVGPWQGRLPGVVFTVAALGLLYYLVRRLYTGPVAVGALSVALFLSGDRWLHPFLVGRPAMGEMPSMFYFLSGLALFSWAWQRPRATLPFVVLLWGLALRTKPQPLPFLVVALLLPLALALRQRCWHTARVVASALAGTLVAFAVLAWGERLLFSSAPFSLSSGAEPYAVLGDTGNLSLYVFTLVPRVRWQALQTALRFAMPLALGLCYSGWKFASNRHQMDMRNGQKVCRLCLWTMVASWLAWWLLMSIGWTRYLFPAVFLGSVFVADLLENLVGGFNLPRLVSDGAKVLKRRRFAVRETGVLLTAIAVPLLALTTVVMLYRNFVIAADDSVVQVARYLNTHAEPDALVETYDSELFFLLERPYHFPPDSVQHQLNRRTFQGQSVAIDYDPLASDLDYLVVGPMSQFWGLYQQVLESGALHLLQSYGRYSIYGRER